MTYFDIGTVQNLKFEPLPLLPREKQWLDTLEFTRDQLLISFSIKLHEPAWWQVEIYESDGEIRLYGPSPLQKTFPIFCKIEKLEKMIERLKQALAERGLDERPTG